MGVNQGRAKRNKQEAKYRNLERRHERSGQSKKGKRKKRKWKTSTEEVTVRRKQEEMERKKQRAK